MTKTVNRYERDAKARNECIQHYGAKCVVYRFDFVSKYGALGAAFIHVHHLVPLAGIGMEYSVNPIEDLVPVCPNCHAMLNKRKPPFSVEELRKYMNAPRKV